ncbi:DgyrCDS951 [Dimorphilus gyrociliatus]|uniref:DgyrCDS951 n=1 Tax=Dimorphilus gyrociliatus TaxID=2664684 RepID=A0A7I8V8X9_9ANNE|nr:DgyrCDS951 [Dimorphilus gyrociliatus]
MESSKRPFVRLIFNFFVNLNMTKKSVMRYRGCIFMTNAFTCIKIGKISKVGMMQIPIVKEMCKKFLSYKKHFSTLFLSFSRGGRLATVNSFSSVQNVIVYIRKANLQLSNGIWIGLSRQKWSWINRGHDEIGKFRWEDSSPNNDGNYVIMRKFSGSYLWQNVKKTNPYKFICQSVKELSKDPDESDFWYWFKIGCIIAGSILIVVLIGIAIYCLRRTMNADKRDERKAKSNRKPLPPRNKPAASISDRLTPADRIEERRTVMVPPRQHITPKPKSRSKNTETLKKEQKQKEIQNDKMSKLFSIQNKLRLDSSPKREQYGSVVTGFPPSITRSNEGSKHVKEKEKSSASVKTVISSNRSANNKPKLAKYGKPIITYNSENRGTGFWQWDMKSKPTVSKPTGKYKISASQSTSGYNSR